MAYMAPIIHNAGLTLAHKPARDLTLYISYGTWALCAVFLLFMLWILFGKDPAQKQIEPAE